MTSMTESSKHSPVETAAVVAHGRIDVDEAVKRVLNVPSKKFGKPTHVLGGAFVAEVETQAARRGWSLYKALANGQFRTAQGLAVLDFRDAYGRSVPMAIVMGGGAHATPAPIVQLRSGREAYVAVAKERCDAGDLMRATAASFALPPGPGGTTAAQIVPLPPDGPDISLCRGNDAIAEGVPESPLEPSKEEALAVV